ncbi:MAG: MoaD/ThiS family protein [Promethearchaeota archaeon]
MEKLDQINDVIDVGSLKSFKVKEEKTVRELLKELKLDNKFFAILINGKKAKLDDVIKEDQSILILPKIAGGY